MLTLEIYKLAFKGHILAFYMGRESVLLEIYLNTVLGVKSFRKTYFTNVKEILMANG